MNPSTPKADPAPGQQTKPPDPPPDQMYRFVGNRAMILDHGQPIGPGEYVTLTAEQIVGVTQIAINDGALIDATGVNPTE